MKKENIRNLQYLFQAIAMACFVELLIVFGEVPVEQMRLDSIFLRRLLLLIAIAVGCWGVAIKTGKTIGNFLFQYRYWVALIALVVLVAFDVSGSSIGVWASYLPNGETNGLLWNIPRVERSDEWATFTPLTFTSFFNPDGSFSYFNTIARGTLTDSFIVYGQPVLDIAILFRPFQIGYLFLGMSRGLSFYWWSRLIALFLSSLELGMLFTKKDKKLSVLFATLVAFAPIVQWWFSINSLVEMFVAGNCFLLMVNQWIQHPSIGRRALYCAIMGICGGCYVLALYPAWMVPLGYFYLALLIWLLYENRKNIVVKKVDFIPLGCFLLVFVGGLLHVVIQSGDTIQAIFNSAYPGKRESFGGDHIHRLFSYVMTPFMSVYQKGFELPNCEYAAFMSLYPIGFLLAIYTWIRQKKKDLLLCVMLIFEVILELFVIWELPGILAKLTLLSWSVPYRVVQMTGIFQIVLIIRSLVLLKELPAQKTKKETIWATGGIALGSVFVVLYFATQMQTDYWTGAMVGTCAVVLFGVFFAIIQHGNDTIKNGGIWIWGLISFFAAMLVNPIQKGIDVVYENELIQQIQEIVEEDAEGKWVVDQLEYPMINAPIMAGASTVNSTNVYPNLELWSMVDEEGMYEEIYNRYAHIVVHLMEEVSEKQEKFTLIQADLFEVDLTLDEVADMGVKYVLTNRKLEDVCSLERERFALRSQCGTYYIYELK